MEKGLLQDIKFNCDVSDARYWGQFSICGLLMRYRDLFRSEQGLPPWVPIDRGEIGLWIEKKESRWPELEGQEFRDLRPDGKHREPFDHSGVNEALNPGGIAYGAGYGMYAKPTFFLARIRSRSVVDGHQVYVTGRELARDLFTTAAMLRDRTIFIRLEPLAALLWERYAQVRPGCGSGLEHAFRSHGIEPGRPPDRALQDRMEQLTASFAGVLLQHELAESRERVASWKDLVAAAGDRLIEQYLRALQDTLADTSEHGPLRSLITDQDEAALGLSLGLLEGYHRLLLAGLIAAFRRFRQERDWQALDEVRRAVYARAAADRRTVLDLREQVPAGELQSGIRRLMQQRLEGDMHGQGSDP